MTDEVQCAADAKQFWWEPLQHKPETYSVWPVAFPVNKTGADGRSEVSSSSVLLPNMRSQLSRYALELASPAENLRSSKVRLRIERKAPDTEPSGERAKRDSGESSCPHPLNLRATDESQLFMNVLYYDSERNVNFIQKFECAHGSDSPLACMRSRPRWLSWARIRQGSSRSRRSGACTSAYQPRKGMRLDRWRT